MRSQKSGDQKSVGTGSVCVSVSPVATSVGLVSCGECWLLAYSVWLGVLTYSLFDPPVEVVPSLWGTPSSSPL